MLASWKELDVVLRWSSGIHHNSNAFKNEYHDINSCNNCFTFQVQPAFLNSWDIFCV